MKNTELMVGDLVLLFGETPARVDAIGNTEVYVYEKERGDWHVGYGHIKPISLTPDILEKNGFVKRIGGRSKKSLQLIGDGLYVSWWNDRIVIRYKRVLGHPSAYLNCDCRYVHELQNALRLAGVEKEIVL